MKDVMEYGIKLKLKFRIKTKTISQYAGTLMVKSPVGKTENTYT
jgi:hypothetical protein